MEIREKQHPYLGMSIVSISSLPEHLISSFLELNGGLRLWVYYDPYYHTSSLTVIKKPIVAAKI